MFIGVLQQPPTYYGTGKLTPNLHYVELKVQIKDTLKRITNSKIEDEVIIASVEKGYSTTFSFG